MKNARTTPSFKGLHPSSLSARRAARGSSKQTDTKCEVVLGQMLRAIGLRFGRGVLGLPGRPDFVFPRQRLVVFCDGDFWHGRDLDSRLARLARGHNASYWIEKIRTNVRRDRATSDRLAAEGWRVVRLWETDILRDPEAAAAVVVARLRTADGEAPNSRFQRTVRCAARR
jgi:DNA mismatch endonuclease (patch repair protein)